MSSALPFLSRNNVLRIRSRSTNQSSIISNDNSGDNNATTNNPSSSTSNSPGIGIKMSRSNDEDEDDDLRSLLSGSSGGSASKPNKKMTDNDVEDTVSLSSLLQESSASKPSQRQQKVSLSSLLQQESRQSNHPHHHRQQQQQQQQQQSQQQEENYITHLPSPSSPTNNIMNNSRNTMSSSPPNVPNVTGRRTLWILGTIILTFGFLGPTGFLWDFFEEDPRMQGKDNLIMGMPDSPHSSNIIKSVSTTGDVHHKVSNVHPMIRTSTNKATGSQQHGKFGSKTKPQRNKNNKNGKNRMGDGEENTIRSNIKDAIDKVFPESAGGRNSQQQKQQQQLQRQKKKQKQLQLELDQKQPNPEHPGSQEEDDDNFLTDDAVSNESNLPFPIIHANDDTLPENAEAMTHSLPASDALECRASVIAFVINATDVKDECDGLRKAFDKTCSVSSVQHAASGGAAAGGGGANGGSSAGGEQQRRRRLQEWGNPRLSNLSPFAAIHRDIGWGNMRYNFGQWHSWIGNWSALRGGNDGTFLSVEDHADTGTWGKANEKMIKMGFDIHKIAKKMMGTSGRQDLGVSNNTKVMLRSTPNATQRYYWQDIPLLSKSRRKLEKHEESWDEARDHGRGNHPTTNTQMKKNTSLLKEERKTAEHSSENQEEVQTQQQQQQDQPPPMISLMIPTADEHIADQMLNDALLLQESSANEKKPPSSQGGLDNSTQPQVPDGAESEKVPNAQAVEAARDASESAEAIRTATEAVKNIMNDAKSIEARTCCASILSVFHEHCDPTTTGEDQYSDRRLLVIVFVITVCGIVKSIIRYFNIRWLPEAGGCILVGVMGYLILQNMPHVQFAFDGDMFLRIMVPPIVFEAAVKINKRSFQRHVIPITLYAIVGTLVSTAFTAFILHKGSSKISWCATIPLKESLIFGSLISSIDPIAVLSVLNNMGMTDSDTIYVLIFGESLLNDGVAIVLFQTLVHFLDESLEIDGEAIWDATMHFVVVAVGSLAVGVLSGACATIYFSIMHGIQTPMVEVIMFFCWAFIPYYICDMVEWSGIVAIVANGFVMDLYVVGQKLHQNSSIEDEIDFLVNGTNSNNYETTRARHVRPRCRTVFSYEGHLSGKADSHVHFVIEIFATLMETAIFAYLGLFLFSPRYHWNATLVAFSIFATVMGRVIMIPVLSHFANVLNRMKLQRNTPGLPQTEIEGVLIDRRMQLVLIFAGLRGAMSFALVEHIPLFDTITGQGSRLKPELKAMTSASVIFTVFVLGGATSYLMERIGYSITKEHDAIEITPLVQNKSTPNNPIAAKRNSMLASTRDAKDLFRSSQPKSSSVRQRASRA